jgi:uncharacterized membrane protein
MTAWLVCGGARMSALLIAHVVMGGLGLISGAAALSVRKGERLHRAFGTVFFLAMLVMAATGRLPGRASAA